MRFFSQKFSIHFKKLRIFNAYKQIGPEQKGHHLLFWTLNGRTLYSSICLPCSLASSFFYHKLQRTDSKSKWPLELKTIFKNSKDANRRLSP